LKRIKDTKKERIKKLIFILKNSSGFCKNRLKIFMLELRLEDELKIGLNNK
jgi:hypothetical protein